jgi:hypothetical protein
MTQFYRSCFKCEGSDHDACLSSKSAVRRDRAETNPALHAAFSPVAAATETMAALDDADAPLAPGAQFLPVAEPALLLLAPARRTLGGAIGDTDPLDALGRGLALLPFPAGSGTKRCGSVGASLPLPRRRTPLPRHPRCKVTVARGSRTHMQSCRPSVWIVRTAAS